MEAGKTVDASSVLQLWEWTLAKTRRVWRESAEVVVTAGAVTRQRGAAVIAVGVQGVLGAGAHTRPLFSST
jgi:hypothetical protein